jgi:hypothetical protein
MTLAVLNDATLMSIQGATFLFIGGFMIGTAINDNAIAPSFGTPTVGESLEYLGGQ